MTTRDFSDLVSARPGFGLVKQHLEALFPDWSSYTPTYTASGSMTFTSVTTTQARYLKINNMGFLDLDISGTTGGTASIAIYASLPVGWTLSRTHSSVPIYVRDATSGVYTNGQAQVTAANGVECYLNAVTNWGLGTGRAVRAYFRLHIDA